MASTVQCSSYFCLPEPGKPDPRVHFSSERPRVTQKEQKGDTCSFYALQILRGDSRIGKHPSEDQKTLRRKELAISKHRKALTLCQLAHEATVRFVRSLPPADAKRFVDNTEEAVKEQLIKCHEKLFSELEFSIETLKNFIPKHMNTKWEELSLIDKEWIGQNVAFYCSVCAYGFEYSSWRPDQPIEALIEQLQLKGPHLIKAKMGRSYYKVAPFLSQGTIEGRPLYGWKPGSDRIERKDFHAIVVVGASSEGDREIVYFVDPADSSSSIKTQKVYMMTMSRLRTTIGCMYGMQFQESEGAFLFDVLEDEILPIKSYAVHRSMPQAN